MKPIRTTQREMIQKAMDEAKDKGPLLACTLTEEELDKDFFAGWEEASASRDISSPAWSGAAPKHKRTLHGDGRAPRGKPFTAWTKKRVYFPTEYDGAEGVASAPRWPASNEATEHV